MASAKSLVLDSENLRSIVASSTRELVMLADRDGKELGQVELIDPPVSRIEDISAQVAERDKAGRLEGVGLIIECSRACCPTFDDLSDEEVWRVLQLGGGANGPLARAALRRVLGVDVANPNPTEPQ